MLIPMDGAAGRLTSTRALVPAVAVAVGGGCVIGSVSTSGRVSQGLALVAGLVAAFALGRHLEMLRQASGTPRATRRHDINSVLGESLARCRRFERPLTLVRVAGPVDPEVRRIMTETVRLTDEVCHEAEASYVLMPEESVIGASVWVRRLAETVELQLVSIAQFPVDALTVDGLLDHARSAATVVDCVDGAAASPMGAAPDAAVIDFDRSAIRTDDLDEPTGTAARFGSEGSL